jgi:hypothetical protein
MESGGLFDEGGAENVENWVVYKVRIIVKFLFLSIFSTILSALFDRI